MDTNEMGGSKNLVLAALFSLTHLHHLGYDDVLLFLHKRGILGPPLAIAIRSSEWSVTLLVDRLHCVQPYQPWFLQFVNQQIAAGTETQLQPLGKDLAAMTYSYLSDTEHT